jgi:hypothetical protein
MGIPMSDQPADPDFFKRAAVAKVAGKRRLLGALGVIVEDEDNQGREDEREPPDDTGG